MLLYFHGGRGSLERKFLRLYTVVEVVEAFICITNKGIRNRHTLIELEKKKKIIIVNRYFWRLILGFNCGHLEGNGGRK